MKPFRASALSILSTYAILPALSSTRTSCCAAMALEPERCSREGDQLRALADDGPNALQRSIANKAVHAPPAQPAVACCA